MNNNLSKLTVSLLNQIAKYSGFSMNSGLYNGKTGSAILLYNGYFQYKSIVFKHVADSLIEDITRESINIKSLCFSTGLSGIAWGINKMMNNGFINFDETWFNEIDRILLSNSKFFDPKENAEYSYNGLYILARYENASVKNCWIDYSQAYFSQMIKLIESKENLFVENRFLLIPFFYFLLKWNTYFPDQESTGNIQRALQCLNKIKFSDVKSVNDIYAAFLYQEVSQEAFPIQQKEKLTISEFNTVFLNRLLYPGISVFPEEIFCRSVSSILEDRMMIKDLLLLLNHKTTGLTNFIPGLAWSLLNCNKSDFSNEISAL